MLNVIFHHIVNDFSKRTGDFASLSGVDKDVIALGVTLAYEKNKTHLLRREPPALTEWIPRDAQNKNSDFVEVNNPYDTKPAATEKAPTTTVEENKQSEVKTDTEVKAENVVVDNAPKTESTEADVKNATEEKETTQETKESESKPATEEKVVKPLNSFGDDDDDEGGWITPANLTKHIHKGTTHNKTLDEMGIAIMTTDFAMQVKLFS